MAAAACLHDFGIRGPDALFCGGPAGGPAVMGVLGAGPPWVLSPVLADVLVFVIAIVVVKFRPAGLLSTERS